MKIPFRLKNSTKKAKKSRNSEKVRSSILNQRPELCGDIFKRCGPILILLLHSLWSKFVVLSVTKVQKWSLGKKNTKRKKSHKIVITGKGLPTISDTTSKVRLV